MFLKAGSLSFNSISDVPCPIVIAVPLSPVPIDIDSLELAVPNIIYASLPCFIVNAFALLSVKAIFISLVVCHLSFIKHQSVQDRPGDSGALALGPYWALVPSWALAEFGPRPNFGP